MKKSAFSTPSGSRGGESYKWRSQENTNRTGYGYVNSDSYQCISPIASQPSSGDDFIPLNISTPVSEQKRHGGSWYGSGGNRVHRNLGSGGYNHHRNNYHATPKSNCNNSYSPYKHSGKQFHGQRKGYQKGMQRQVDISRYIDMKSFLEDPWAKLTRKLNESMEVDKNDSSIFDSSRISKLVNNSSEQDSESKSTMDVSSSQCSPQSKHDSSVNVTLGLDDTDLSQVSKTESSIDLKLDDMKFSHESKNESLSSIDDGIYEEPCTEDIVHPASESEKDIAHKLT